MADIYYLPGALEARMKANAAAAQRRKKDRASPTLPPDPFEGLTPLDVLNRIAVRMGLPALPREEGPR
jgi:hypothetical protein